MTEEFIPRDTPIYCFVANNEKDLNTARQTRDIWTERWEYTNFIIQERFSNQRLIEIFNDKLNITDEVINQISENVFFNYSINILYLLEKLRYKKQNSIIIQSNTILKNDLPLSYLNNDLNFLHMYDYGKVDLRYGIMLSQQMVKAKYDYVFSRYIPDNSFERQIELLGISNAVQNIQSDPYDFINQLANCKHNLETLKEKTQDLMHAELL